MRHLIVLLLLLPVLAGCGRNRAGDLPQPRLDGPLAAGTAPEVVDSLYAQAEALFRSGKWSKSLSLLNRVTPVLLPEDPRYLRARFYVGEIHYAMSEYLQATRELRRLADENPEHPLAPDALFRAGMAYRQLWRKPQLDPTYGETALQVFAEVATRYPGTPAAARSQTAIAELQEWHAEKEFRNARFYLRWKANDSAILVLRDIVANYPRTSVVPRALIAMVEAYVRLGYAEDRQETCEYIRQYYPATPGLAKACPAAPSGSP